MSLVFTICSNNYLAQAVTLGKSLLSNNSNYRFVIGLVDKKKPEIDYAEVPFEIEEVENIGIRDLEKMYLRYNITELSTAVKPYYFRYFFKNTSENEPVIYLDPDIYVYSAFTGLESELLNFEIIITPHFTKPLDDDLIQPEEDFLSTGLYNLGFIAIKNTGEGRKMTDWWADRLFDKAHIDLERGLFTDQKWINFVPLFFKSVKIFTNPGYNMAYWNLHERKLTRREGTNYVNETVQLSFYHFSGYDPTNPDILSKYQNRHSIKELPELAKLFSDYGNCLITNGFNKYKQYKNHYSEIKRIADYTARRDKIKRLPLLIRLFRIIVMKVTVRHDLYLD